MIFTLTSKSIKYTQDLPGLLASSYGYYESRKVRLSFNYRFSSGATKDQRNRKSALESESGRLQQDTLKPYVYILVSCGIFSFSNLLEVFFVSSWSSVMQTLYCSVLSGMILNKTGFFLIPLRLNHRKSIAS
jgi:hypothetical protein